MFIQSSQEGQRGRFSTTLLSIVMHHLPEGGGVAFNCDASPSSQGKGGNSSGKL